MGMEFEVVEPFEMEDTYGTTNTSRNIMRIRSDVYEGAIHDNPRDRFTLCHELGHYILHQPENISYARGDIPVYQNPEWQANTFAAELLIPDELIYENPGMPREQIARLSGYNEMIMKFKEL